VIAVASLTVDNIIGLVIAVLLIAYLIVALIIPEKF
jgi:K+-transporting ATPase KdpF subunit